MTIAISRFALAVSACVTAACVPATSDDDAEQHDTDDADSSTAADPSLDTDASSDDTSTADPTAPTSDPTADPTSDTEDPTDTGVAPGVLGDDVVLFVKAIDTTDDALWAYDVASGEAFLVDELGDAGEITSIAIAPDRTRVAMASTYESVDYQATETIWRLDVDADGDLGAPVELMPAIPPPIGVSSGYSQQIDSLHWHPDGSALWFDHAFNFDISSPGGGALGLVDAATGEYELFIDHVGDCTVNTSPAPSPDGTALLAIRGVCIESAHEGLVGFDLPVAAEPEVIVPSTDMVFATPRWIGGGTGIVFAASIDYDSDGDGANDIYGHALLLLDTTTGDQYVVVAPSTSYIWDFAVSPDETRFVLCVSGDGGQNLLLVDLSGDEPTSTWLTDDGASCTPAW